MYVLFKSLPNKSTKDTKWDINVSHNRRFEEGHFQKRDCPTEIGTHAHVM